jgi:hypothetical protein
MLNNIYNGMQGGGGGDNNSYPTSVIYGFKIDKNDDNPATRVHYMADNENFSSAYMDYTQDEFNYGD